MHCGATKHFSSLLSWEAVEDYSGELTQSGRQTTPVDSSPHSSRLQTGIS